VAATALVIAAPPLAGAALAGVLAPAVIARRRPWVPAAAAAATTAAAAVAATAATTTAAATVSTATAAAAATVSAAAAAAAVTTAAAATAVSAAATTAATPLFGLVDSNAPTVKLRAVHRFDGRLGGLSVFIGDEAEASTATGVPVLDHDGLTHLSELGECVGKPAIVGGPSQTSDEELGAHDVPLIHWGFAPCSSLSRRVARITRFGCRVADQAR